MIQSDFVEGCAIIADMTRPDSRPMSALPKLLIITRFYPPDAEVGGKRVAHLARHLPAYGVEPIVLTVEERFCEHRDDSFAGPPVRVERTALGPSTLDLYPRLRKWTASRQAPGERVSGHGPRVAEDRSNDGVLRRNISAILRMPDRHSNWFHPAVEAAERLIAGKQIDAILSTAPPFTCHIIARHLKRKYGVPWLAEFRDAWTFDPWRALERLPWWREWLDRRSERSCVADADRVIALTATMQKRFASEYSYLSEPKFLTLTNGFEESRFEDWTGKTSNCGKKLILHLGTLYGDRRIDTFCRAAANLLEQGTFQQGEFRILFLGAVDVPELVESARHTAPGLFAKEVIEVRPPVPWQEAQKLLHSADLLLIFQGSNDMSIPAKFYEYLQSGVPILSIGKAGALSAIVQETSCGCFAEPDSVEEIQAGILRGLALPLRSPEEVMRCAAHYGYRFLAAQLAKWVYETLGGPGSVPD
jgi:glycosyltransferase involved in cell wall biosynthesis